MQHQSQEYSRQNCCKEEGKTTKLIKCSERFRPWETFRETLLILSIKEEMVQNYVHKLFILA